MESKHAQLLSSVTFLERVGGEVLGSWSMLSSLFLLLLTANLIFILTSLSHHLLPTRPLLIALLCLDVSLERWVVPEVCLWIGKGFCDQEEEISIIKTLRWLMLYLSLLSSFLIIFLKKSYPKHIEPTPVPYSPEHYQLQNQEEVDENDLRSLSRRELQEKAKKVGIRANLSTNELISQLTDHQTN